MKAPIRIFLAVLTLSATPAPAQEKTHTEEYTGVVTAHLIPAKVIKINKIIENPKPGTSYIGEEGILVEIEENPNIMANWSVVKISYLEYPEPKTIKYEILSEQHEITVKYHAVNIEVTGDLSSYIKE
jgi:hypothetical protein